MRGLAIAAPAPAAVALWKIAAIIPHSLDDSQTFCPALAEQEAVTGSEVLRPLDELERHRRSVPRTDERPVDIDDGACLADRADVQHRLVLLLDGGGVAENQHLGDELVVDPWRRGAVGWFRQHDHALADVFPLDFFQGEGSALACARGWYSYPFPFNGTDGARCELAKTVGTDEDAVAGMNNARLDDTRHDSSDERDGKSVVDVEFERRIGVVPKMSVGMLKNGSQLKAYSPSMMRKDVQECSY